MEKEVAVPIGIYGSYELTDKGVYKLDDTGKTRISNPLYIEQTQQNLISRDVELTLVYRYRDRWCDIIISRQELNDKKIQALSKKGLDVHSGNAKDLEAYLIAQEATSQYVSSYDYVGWHEENEKLHFALDCLIQETEESVENVTYDGKFDLKPTGDKETYFELIKNEVVGHPPLEFILALACSGVLNSYVNFSKSSDLIFSHLYGESSSGKTTAAKLAASVFGKPSVTSDGLIRTWNATTNALVSQFGNMNGTPLILDEASLCNNSYDFSATIYKFSQGMDKVRSNSNLTMRDSYSWSGVLISTAEHELVERTNRNSGLKARVLELQSVEWTKDRIHAETLNSTLESHYGWLGREFVNYFLKNKKDSLKDDLLRNEEWLLESQKAYVEGNTALSERILKKYAYVLLAAEYLNECFDFNLNEEEILTFILDNDKKQAPRRDRVSAAMTLINTKIVENENSILNAENFCNSNGKIIGKHTSKDTAILKDIVDGWLIEAGYNDPQQVMSEIKQKELISAEVNRNTRKRKINGREVLVYVFYSH